MPNIFWYLLLTGFSIILLIFTLIKSDTKTSICVYLTLGGLAFALDFLVLIIFHGYEYHPNIFPQPWWDYTLGSMISQGIAVPAVGTFIIMFHMKLRWYFFASLFFMGIEEFFIYLDIYEHLWWKTIYTGIFIFFGFLYTRLWKGYLKNPSPLIQFLTIYFLALISCNTLRFLFSSVFHAHLYHIGWYDNPIRDHIAFNALFIFVFSLLISAIVVFHFRWYAMIGLFFISVFIYTLFRKLDILWLNSEFIVVIYSLLYVLLLFVFRSIYKQLFTIRLN